MKSSYFIANWELSPLKADYRVAGCPEGPREPPRTIPSWFRGHKCPNHPSPPFILNPNCSSTSWIYLSPATHYPARHQDTTVARRPISSPILMVRPPFSHRIPIKSSIMLINGSPPSPPIITFPSYAMHLNPSFKTPPLGHTHSEVIDMEQMACPQEAKRHAKKLG